MSPERFFIATAILCHKKKNIKISQDARASKSQNRPNKLKSKYYAYSRINWTSIYSDWWHHTATTLQHNGNQRTKRNACRKKNKNKTHKQRGNPINPKHIKQIDLLMKSLIINERCKSNLVINDFGQR